MAGIIKELVYFIQFLNRIRTSVYIKCSGQAMNVAQLVVDSGSVPVSIATLLINLSPDSDKPGSVSCGS